MERHEMTIEQERQFVEKMFREFEKEITETFWTPYSDYRNNIGQEFKIIRRLNEDDVDLECLPMWKIRLSDGMEIDSYPEEIVKSVVGKYRESYEKMEDS